MLNKAERIYLACGSTDMRKSIDGLVAIVKDKFELSPYEKIWFVFCNGGRDRLKILTWEDNGFWIYFKRLEKGRFMWPSKESDDKMALSFEELEHIIKGPGVKEKIKRTQFKTS